MANVKNYTEQGGDKTVIGGDLEVVAGGKETVRGELIIAASGKLKFGVNEFKRAAAVPEAAGEAPTAAEFKALLDALKAAGLMATT